MPAEEITICQLLSDSWKFSSTSVVQMKKLMITSCKNLAQQWLTSASSPQKNSALTSLLPNLNKLLIQDEGLVFIIISKCEIEPFIAIILADISSMIRFVINIELKTLGRTKLLELLFIVLYFNYEYGTLLHF